VENKFKEQKFGTIGVIGFVFIIIAIISMFVPWFFLPNAVKDFGSFVDLFIIFNFLSLILTIFSVIFCVIQLFKKRTTLSIIGFVLSVAFLLVLIFAVFL